jgi:hypothetical protein
MVAAVYAWVLSPSLVRFAPASYDPKVDIANELYGWPTVIAKVKDVARQVRPIDIAALYGDVAVVGPHWTICAQLHAALGASLPVGCATPVRDDFDDWYPRDTWERADTILFVTDKRFDVDAAALLPNHVFVRDARVTIFRGGRPARFFSIHVFTRRALARADEAR